MADTGASGVIRHSHHQWNAYSPVDHVAAAAAAAFDQYPNHHHHHHHQAAAPTYYNLAATTDVGGGHHHHHNHHRMDVGGGGGGGVGRKPPTGLPFWSPAATDYCGGASKYTNGGGGLTPCSGPADQFSQSWCGGTAANYSPYTTNTTSSSSTSSVAAAAAAAAAASAASRHSSGPADTPQPSYLQQQAGSPVDDRNARMTSAGSTGVDGSAAGPFGHDASSYPLRNYGGGGSHNDPVTSTPYPPTGTYPHITYASSSRTYI